MLERAKERTRTGRYTHVEYARWADDLVILGSGVDLPPYDFLPLPAFGPSFAGARRIPPPMIG